MSFKSKLKVEGLGVRVFSIFYAVAGGAEALILAISNFRLPHVGVLAVLSLTAAYGLFRMRKWSVLLVVALLFPQITFGITTLYASIMMQSFYPSLGALLFHLALIAFVFFYLVSFSYVVARRKAFR